MSEFNYKQWLVENKVGPYSKNLKESGTGDEPFDFNKAAIESATGDKISYKDETDDYGRPIYWSTKNPNVTYYIGGDDQIIKYDGETGKETSIGYTFMYDEPTQDYEPDTDADYEEPVDRNIQSDYDDGEFWESDVEKFKKIAGVKKEGIDQHKRRVYLKAAIEMAKSYSSRGYTPDEAVKDAAQGIKNVYGYELTDKDKQAVKHFVPVNAQFKEATWTSTNTSQPLKGEKPGPNITDDDLAPRQEKPVRSGSSNSDIESMKHPEAQNRLKNLRSRLLYDLKTSFFNGYGLYKDSQGIENSLLHTLESDFKRFGRYSFMNKPFEGIYPLVDKIMSKYEFGNENLTNSLWKEFKKELISIFKKYEY